MQSAIPVSQSPGTQLRDGNCALGGQRTFMDLESAYSLAMQGNLPPWKPILPLVSDHRWSTRPATAMRLAGELPNSLAHLSQWRRSKPLDRAVHICQADSVPGNSGMRIAVIVFVMALLSFGDSNPSRAAKGGQRN
jgi:hypothetical protein